MTRDTRSTGRAPMLRDSVEQVWLAGLGALALTEEEGLRFFKRLVRKGEGFERETRARLDRAVVRARAVPGAAMERIEERLDGTMTGALHRLGVPTTREIESLKRRIDGLATTIQQRGATARRSAAAGRKATPAKRGATSRRATSRRAPARTAARKTAPA